MRSLIIWEVSDVKQPLQDAFSQTASASAPYRPTIRRYFSRYSSGIERFGFDDRCFQLLELRLVGSDLVVELFLKRSDLGGRAFYLVLKLLELGSLSLDGLVRDKNIFLDLRLRGVVVRDLVLKGLVLFVFLDLVQLDLEVIDLGVDALERVLVFIELNLAVLQRLLGGIELGLTGGKGRLSGGQCSGPEASRSRSALARWCSR